MARFDIALPGAVLRLHYEHLVDDTEAEVARMLAHAGVPFDKLVCAGTKVTSLC